MGLVIRKNNIEKTASEIALKINILITQHMSRSDDKMHPNIQQLILKHCQMARQSKKRVIPARKRLRTNLKLYPHKIKYFSLSHKDGEKNHRYIG